MENATLDEYMTPRRRRDIMAKVTPTLSQRAGGTAGDPWFAPAVLGYIYTHVHQPKSISMRRNIHPGKCYASKRGALLKYARKL